MTHRRHLAASTLALFAALAMQSALPPTAHAAGTRSFVLDDAKTLGEGKLEGTALHSSGHLTVGLDAQRVEMKGVSVAYSLLIGRDGSAFVGTGNEGKVLHVRGETVKELAATGQLLVASMTFGERGTIYAGTLPAGKVFEIDVASGKSKELVALPGAQHVWGLAYDAKKKRLYAATGPEGKVFTIDARGKAEVLYDSPAEHIMSLALDADGTLYAGTSNEALVLRLSTPGRAEVLYDFPGNEITHLSVRKGTLAVAANQFPKAPAGSRPNAGKGAVWKLSSDGRAELLYEDASAHITAVQLADDGSIYASSGKGGRIHRIDGSRSHATLVEVDERQVLAFDLLGAHPTFVTGDTGALYHVSRGRPKKAHWTSAVLDAKFPSRWGRLTWRAAGAIEMQTRSGNTAEPDATWSEWSVPMSAANAVRSPAGRFVQVRARFEKDANAKLWAAELYYLPANQRAAVVSVQLTESASKAGHDAKPSPLYPLTWKVSNEDGDPLRYRMRFRAEGQTIWRDMLKPEETLEETKYTWDTSGIPDGWYVVQVEASDERANPEARALRATGESEPILVDNHPPEVEDLRHAKGVLTGRATDTQGPIAKLEMAVDGGRWQVVFPTDGLLDSANESFEIPLDRLAAGDHIVAVRAADARGNMTTAETTIRVGGKNR